MMMDSVMEISSGSSSSDDEVSEPIRQETRAGRYPTWLYGRRSFPQRGPSAGNSQDKPGDTNDAPLSGAPSYTSRPRDSTGNDNILNSRIANVSGVDNEKPSAQQTPETTTLPPSISSTPSPSSSANSNSISHGNGSHFGADFSSPAVGMNGVSILPPSMTHETPAAPSDPMDKIGIGEDRRSDNDERLIYQAALRDLNQPNTEIDLRPGTLSVPLMKHQKIALAWMFQKETSSVHCSGGILADDQGLGKTVSTIALILKQKFESQIKSEISSNQEAELLDLDADDESENGNHESESHARPAAGTLIVCPASVVRQWARELDDKVSDGYKLSILIYHGGNRTKDPIELAKYDVVVTTYAIVANEVPKQPLVGEAENDDRASKKRGRKCFFEPGTLSKVGWLRVVLDEAQTIKNHRTKMARACYSLRAKRRWCLSGSPIQNTIDDLYSYFRFLRYNPYAVYESFKLTIKFPILRNSQHGYKKLQAVLRAIMLRRTKGTLLDGQPIINLPPKNVNLNKVDFSVEERSLYKKLEADSRLQFKAYDAAGTLNQNYANVLVMLLRLRQACDHPRLVHGYNSDPVDKESVEALPMEARINLLNCLESSSAICNICNDPPENPVVTLCGHVFCYQCVSEQIYGGVNMCPVQRCREDMGRDGVFSESALRNCITNDLGSTSSQDVKENEFRSSKIKAVLHILQSLSRQGSPHNDDGVTVVEPATLDSSSPNQGPIKSLVFSQWTGMLDLVELCLIQNGIEFRRLDGTMSLAARDRAVKEFSNDPDVEVMLMSLKAGNVGLNMVAACHVILLDLWWNPTTEDQAIDRAHRIGQTRPVTVTRLTIKDTVEDRILDLQDQKRKIAASAFGEDYGGNSATRLTVDDLRYLFMV